MGGLLYVLPDYARLALLDCPSLLWRDEEFLFNKDTFPEKLPLLLAAG